MLQRIYGLFLNGLRGGSGCLLARPNGPVIRARLLFRVFFCVCACGGTSATNSPSFFVPTQVVRSSALVPPQPSDTHPRHLLSVGRLGNCMAEAQAPFICHTCRYFGDERTEPSHGGQVCQEATCLFDRALPSQRQQSRSGLRVLFKVSLRDPWRDADVRPKA